MPVGACNWALGTAVTATSCVDIAEAGKEACVSVMAAAFGTGCMETVAPAPAPANMSSLVTLPSKP